MTIPVPSQRIENPGLPSLAGIATYDEASRPGVSVDENTTWLRRYNYIKVRLVETISAHITGTPEWEVKSGLSLHLWLDAEHSAMIRKRVGEMREPPLQLDQVPHQDLKLWLDEVLRARNSIELIVGIYWVVRPALTEALMEHLEKTNPLIDYPTVRMLRTIMQEEEEMQTWGSKVIRALLANIGGDEVVEEWENHLIYFLEKAVEFEGMNRCHRSNPSSSRDRMAGNIR